MDAAVTYAIGISISAISVATVLGTALWIHRRTTRARQQQTERDALDALHTLQTGVPASNSHLGRDPRTGRLHLRDRTSARTPTSSPRDRADHEHTTVEPRHNPGAGAAGTGMSAALPGANDAHAVSEALAFRNLRRLIAGDACDVDALDEAARRWPVTAGVAALFALCEDLNPSYERHLSTAVAYSNAVVGNFPMIDLRAKRRIRVPLPADFAVAHVPCDADGLAIADLVWRIHHAEEPPTLDELTFRAAFSPHPLLDAVRSELEPAVGGMAETFPDPTGPPSGWDVLAAHQQVRAACRDHAPDLIAVGDRFDAILNEYQATVDPDGTQVSVRIDVDALRRASVLCRATVVGIGGDLAAAETLLDRLEPDAEATALRRRLHRFFVMRGEGTTDQP